MEIYLNLKKHCIKTEIKRNYENALKSCLKNQIDHQIELRLEVLKNILEKNDFVKIRGENKELMGGKDHRVVLKIEKNEKYIIIDKEKRVNLL